MSFFGHVCFLALLTVVTANIEDAKCTDDQCSNTLLLQTKVETNRELETDNETGLRQAWDFGNIVDKVKDAKDSVEGGMAIAATKANTVAKKGIDTVLGQANDTLDLITQYADTASTKAVATIEKYKADANATLEKNVAQLSAAMNQSTDLLSGLWASVSGNVSAVFDLTEGTLKSFDQPSLADQLKEMVTKVNDKVETVTKSAMSTKEEMQAFAVGKSREAFEKFKKALARIAGYVADMKVSFKAFFAKFKDAVLSAAGKLPQSLMEPVSKGLNALEARADNTITHVTDGFENITKALDPSIDIVSSQLPSCGVGCKIKNFFGMLTHRR